LYEVFVKNKLLVYLAEKKRADKTNVSVQASMTYKQVETVHCL